METMRTQSLRTLRPFYWHFSEGSVPEYSKNFILFMTPGGRLIKILAGYHQYFAVEKAVHSTMLASKTDGRGGVFWHTQGSGKSLSMVFYTHLLDQQMDDPTFVVLTDRRDLDDQLFKTFSDCHKFLRQTPVQATSRDNLYELLNNRQSGGIIFTIMAKFEDEWGALSKRKNIIVMADEAHRSQYGLTEKFVTTKDQYGNILAKTVIGAAKKVRDSLPNATYIGFTGTPIDSEDKDTRAVFGDYIDIYDMTQAVEDGATRPVYYESRVMKLKLDEETLRRIDNTYDMLAAEADEITIDKSKKN
ncbi:DEAD/DEAH box helicase family protein [Allobaculum sp. Allo2]|uniref:DEAD/DEAH box helicase family protein n=1 Tax=Allobaculum sp. Allo2 TaxID=2853432 RepID=UPI001F61D180